MAFSLKIKITQVGSKYFLEQGTYFSSANINFNLKRKPSKNIWLPSYQQRLSNENKPLPYMYAYPSKLNTLSLCFSDIDDRSFSSLHSSCIINLYSIHLCSIILSYLQVVQGHLVSPLNSPQRPKLYIPSKTNYV